MTEAGLKLALVADDAKSLAFAWRQSKVDLHTDGVHEKREPTGHAEIQTKSSRDLCVAAEARFDRNPAVGGAVDGRALREVAFEHFSTVLEESNFRARHGAVVAAIRADEKGTNDHDNAQSDDGGGVEPRSQHPGAMLLDLEPLNVVVCHGGAQGGHYSEYAHECLSLHPAAERATSDHQSADVG